MPRKIVLVRHGDDPPDDRVATFAIQNGFEPAFVRPFKGDKLGPPGPDVAGSVVYGGPYNVFEEDKHPFLNDEADWIRACIANDIPLLGICQGAQQIARTLGAWAGPYDTPVHEFGYYPISPTPEGRDFLPETLHMTQSHFHTFAIPEGAVHLAVFFVFQVLIVADQHNAVAGRHTQNGEKTNQRTQRNDTMAEQIGSQHTTDHRHWQAEERHGSQAPTA